MSVVRINISAKCSDLCVTTLEMSDGTEKEKDGYVPHIDGIGGGDYIELTIDNATGKVINWVPIQDDEVNELLDIEEAEEEEPDDVDWDQVRENLGVGGKDV